MIVPHDARGAPISFKIPVSWLRAAGYLAMFFVLVVGSSVVYSTLLSRRLVNYADTLYKNREQQEVIKTFSDKTGRVAKAIDELVEKDNELRKLLGLKGWQSKVKLSTSVVSREAKTDKISIEIE